VGTPGALAVLHTHNRQLGFHPHVHVCMPAAAFSAKERLWRTKVQLGKVFAAKVRAVLADAWVHAARWLARALGGGLQGRG
jgi:hypothetical protein